MVQTSLKKILVGQDRNRRRSRLLIGPGHTDRVESLVEFGAEQAQARGGFLDLGNQRRARSASGRVECDGEAERAGIVSDLGLEFGEIATALLVASFGLLVFENPRQDHA